MRLVIDLQACQHGSNHDAALDQALRLARSAGPHQVWIALDGGQPERIEWLRAAFDGVLPPERVRSYLLPAPADGGDAAWRSRAAELVRDNFLLGLAPDLVYAPALFDGTAQALCAARPHPQLPTAFSLARGTVLDAPASEAPEVLEAWQRSQSSLRSAALLLAANAELAARIERAVEPEQVAVAGADSAPEALWALFSAAAARHAGAAPAPRRPRLAYLSPLPPEQSGIADYSADVLPALARYYDIEIVAEQGAIGAPHIAANFPLRSPAWFDAHAQQFDRIVYHFGNNPMHGYMFAMLQRHPGVVILHDFYLSGVVDWLDHSGGQPGLFPRALYQAHGYGALDALQRDRTAAIWDHPANAAVLAQAAGVIVHSDYARALASQWYGPDAAQDWQVVTLPRRPLDRVAGDGRRAAARAALGLAEDDFLVCSFGMLGATKLNAELVDAFLASPLGRDPRCKLVFVGQAAAQGYGQQVRERIAASGAAARILITGFVPPETYADYGAAADIAVQLRSMTRGETSAAILDCLLYGAATIINAHGAAADIGDDVLLKLPDAFTVEQLADALQRLHGDAALRARLGAAAEQLVRSAHAPAAAARGYHAAIEQFAARHPRRHYQELLAGLARLPHAAAAQPGELLAAARAIAWNQPPRGLRQLFVDISALVESDLRTGIQRVVRSVLKALIDAPPPGWRVEPVYGDGGNRPYRYARRYMLQQLGLADPGLEDAPLALRPDDVFLGLDLYTNGTAQNRAQLMAMRQQGVAVHFVVYDVLPMLRPDWFPFGTQDYFGDYLDTLSEVANGVVCISRAVADELTGWMAERPWRRQSPLKLGYFHLGADIDASKPSFGLSENAEQVFAAVAARPSLLMVGTLEPRKGHAQALAAFDLLWQQGVDANLVIVGKEGWMVEQLAKRLRSHPEREQRLFWLAGVSDEMLLKLYQSCSGLLAASEGEGFGLPLIEAAQHGIPILARDIPVFREVTGAHAHYFRAADAAQLGAALTEWLALLTDGKAPGSDGMPWLKWQQSAQQLVDVVVGQRWYRSLTQDQRAAPPKPEVHE